MLHFIREQVQGWIAWAIVILLIIPFALWGINEYFDTGGPLVAATVNGEKISQRVYQQAYYAQRNRLQEMLGDQYDPGMYDARIKQQALDDLIDRELLYQVADDAGYRISESTVIETIKSIDGFKEAGQFSNDLYVKQLGAQGESPAGFEQRLARSILTQQLYTGITGSELVTDAQIDATMRLQDQTRDISHLTLVATNHKDENDASDEALKQYYESNLPKYMTEEQVSIEYVELSVNKLVTDVEVTDEELKKYYDDRANQYKVSAERRTRHILVSVEQDADEKTIEAARIKATDLHAKIVAGSDFEKLAEEFSDDPGSAKLGGDIGYFGKGTLDPNYEKAMYNLNKGEVSEPVLSSFGFHIIKLDAIRAEKTKSFAEAKEGIKKEYQRDVADKKFFELSEKLTNLAYEVSSTLDDAAGAVGLPVKTTELFGRRGGGNGIAANPRVAAAAFSDDVLRQGYNSEAIEIGENHIVVLRVKDHKEKAQQTLDEVKKNVTNQLLMEKARQRVSQLGDDVVRRLKNGEPMQAIAAELKLKEKNSGALKRTDRSINAMIVNKAFQLGKTEAAKTSYGNVILPSGDYVVIAVSNITDGDPSKSGEAERLTLKRTLVGSSGEASYSSLLSGLKAKAQIIKEADDI
jgi:peptidyl-prolyl cis-trans isomerase D